MDFKSNNIPKNSNKLIAYLCFYFFKPNLLLTKVHELKIKQL
jgi:predicted permease